MKNKNYIEVDVRTYWTHIYPVQEVVGSIINHKSVAPEGWSADMILVGREIDFRGFIQSIPVYVKSNEN